MVRLLCCFGSRGATLDDDKCDFDDSVIELGRDELRAMYDACLRNNGGRLIVEGIFARANTKNNNRRVYPKKVLKREVARYAREHILPGTALGELDHPNYASRFFKCLNLPNISHQVLSVCWKGDQLLGTIEILPTPSGLLLWELYSQGIRLGVSSRGWASLRSDPKDKVVYVDDDFELITFDFVTEPSTAGAFLVPRPTPYMGHIPDQVKAAQIAHLGHGVVSMRNIVHLPDVPELVACVNKLQAGTVPHGHPLSSSGGGAMPGCLAGPVVLDARAKLLDQLLLFSHYVVFPQALHLVREAATRDYLSHLAMFATRAHLADKAALLGKHELTALILREAAREETAAAGTPTAIAAVPPPSPILLAPPSPIVLAPLLPLPLSAPQPFSVPGQCPASPQGPPAGDWTDGGVLPGAAQQEGSHCSGGVAADPIGGAGLLQGPGDPPLVVDSAASVARRSPSRQCSRSSRALFVGALAASPVRGAGAALDAAPPAPQGRRVTAEQLVSGCSAEDGTPKAALHHQSHQADTRADAGTSHGWAPGPPGPALQQAPAPPFQQQQPPAAPGEAWVAPALPPAEAGLPAEQEAQVVAELQRVRRTLAAFNAKYRACREDLVARTGLRVPSNTSAYAPSGLRLPPAMRSPEKLTMA